MNRMAKYVFVDYEGTLSEAPKDVTMTDLLFGDVFTNLKPNEAVKKFLLAQNAKQIFVLGVVDTEREIRQKSLWLQKHCPFIPKENYLFISGEHRKVDVITAYAQKYEWAKSDILFIDDKEKHLVPAQQAGYTCIETEKNQN